MHIRDMETADFPAVDGLMQQLHQAHLRARPDLYAPLEHPYPREEFEHLVENPKVIALAAVEEQQVVGLCIVTLRDKSGMVSLPIAYMDDLVVDEAFRHRGIARALFQASERRAKALGAQRLDLMVWSFNENARQFYAAQGMTPQRYIYEKML